MTTAFIIAVLGFYGVSASEMIRFGAYVVLGLALPGLLLIRALYRGTRTLPEEMALGLALGYAIEALTYIAGRAAGAPLLVVAWPIGTYVLFLAVPRLRRHWGGGSRPRTPMWWSWSMALIVAYLTVWGAVNFFRTHSPTWPGLAASYIDMPFHLALIGELKHHVPPTVPMVAGEPLSYHWFVYAHFAAASWITGIEPLMLLFRLAMLPMMAALFILLGMIGRRVIGSWIGAIAAVAGIVFMAAPKLYVGLNVGLFAWRGVQSWTSPTVTFGALLFAPVILLLTDLLEPRRQDIANLLSSRAGGPARWTPGPVIPPAGRTASHWFLLVLFLVTIIGAKATLLPMLTAGLTMVAVVEGVRRRRPPWPVLAILAVTAACLLYAQFVLFGGARQGMMIDPFDLVRKTWAGLTAREAAAAPWTAVLGVTLLYLLCWVVTWCGILGLLSRPRLLLRPTVALMLGMGAAALGVVLLLGHPHLSQLYFFEACYPYLMIVSIYGFTVVTRRAHVSPRAMTYAAGAGVGTAYLIHALCRVETPFTGDRTDTVLYVPYLVLVAVVLLAALVLNVRGPRLRAWALTLCMLVATGMPAAWYIRVASIASPAPAPTTQPAAARVVPDGILEAGRWLRAHSRPDELVATNAHCLWDYENPCDSRHFWVAALAERHVLVEGWTYTARNFSRWQPLGPQVQNLPFWDGERFRLNEAVFSAPSADSVQRLRDRYGVRWLFADERHTAPDSKIGAFAELRFRSGDYAVYQVPDASGADQPG